MSRKITLTIQSGASRCDECQFLEWGRTRALCTLFNVALIKRDSLDTYTAPPRTRECLDADEGFK